MAEADRCPPTADGGQERPPVTPVACAYCDSTDTELMSLFGQSLLGSQYYCHNCHSVFEAVRWTETPPSSSESDSRRMTPIPLRSASGTIEGE